MYTFKRSLCQYERSWCVLKKKSPALRRGQIEEEIMAFTYFYFTMSLVLWQALTVSIYFHLGNI